MALKRTLKLFTAVVLKRTDWRLGRYCTVLAVWHRLTAEEAEAGAVAADVPAEAVAGGEAAGADMLAGENGGGESIDW